jgi:tRNA (cmo5U34)-methyltransferase
MATSSQEQQPKPPAFNFNDPGVASRYAEGPPKFIPGFSLSHRLAVQLLSEKVDPNSGHLLVLGAGGGLELKAFSEARPGWRFTGVDPSEQMLQQAQTYLGAAASKVEWVTGVIADAPKGPYDGATCLLTLHCIADDGSKLATLKGLQERLKPGAPLILVDHCLSIGMPDLQLRLDRYTNFAVESGAPREMAEKARAAVEGMLPRTGASQEREEELLREAGFKGITLMFAALSMRGWVAYA